MNRIEQTMIGIDLLRCSDSFEQRLGQFHVASLAESIRECGIIHPPVVRASDYQVIAGEDRIAAHVLLNRDEVLVDLVECTDEEVETIREHENLHRRSATPAEVKALVEQLEEEAVEEVETVVTGIDFGFQDHLVEATVDTGTGELLKVETVKRGRPKTARGAAVEEAANKLGVTTNAVYKKLQQAKKDGPPFETWGREVDPKLVADAAESYKSITHVVDKLNLAHQALLHCMKKAHVVDEDAAEWLVEIADVIDNARAARPVGLCPYCKGVAAKCHHCRDTKLLLSGRAHAVPPELKEPKAIATEDVMGF